MDSCFVFVLCRVPCPLKWPILLSAVKRKPSSRIRPKIQTQPGNHANSWCSNLTDYNQMEMADQHMVQSITPKNILNEDTTSLLFYCRL